MLHELEYTHLRTEPNSDLYSNGTYLDEIESNEDEESSDFKSVTVSVDTLREVYQNFVEVGSSTNSRKLRQSLKYSSINKSPKIDCVHRGRDQTCEVSKLTDDDIQFFFKRVYQNRSKIDQDRHILQFIEVCEPRRRRPRIKNQPEKSRLVMTYFVYNKNGDKFKVCARSFESICCISRSRMNRLSKRFYFTHELPIERRGGHSKSDKNVNDSIVNHINSFNPEKTQEDGITSVRKMWLMWTNDRRSQGLVVAPYNHYLSIFKRCSSTFTESSNEDVFSRIKSESMEDEKQSTVLDSEFVSVKKEIIDDFVEDVIDDATETITVSKESPEDRQTFYVIPDCSSANTTMSSSPPATFYESRNKSSGDTSILDELHIDSLNPCQINDRSCETSLEDSKSDFTSAVTKTYRNCKLNSVSHVIGRYPRRTVSQSKSLVKKSRKQLQLERYSSANKEPTIQCQHFGRNQTCEARYLTEEDVRAFFDRLYQHKTKSEQNCHLLQFIEIEIPRRHRPRKGSKRPTKNRLVISHFINTIAGRRIRVCARSFETITCVSRSRLTLLCRKFSLTRKDPTAHRRKRHLRKLHNDLSEIIENDIRRHEAANDSRVNIKNMWQLWKNKRSETGQSIVSYHTYRNIFKRLYDCLDPQDSAELESTNVKIEYLDDV